MAGATSEKPATDDVSRLSDLEKDANAKDSYKVAGFEDPDAGLSEEERARIVRNIVSIDKNDPLQILIVLPLHHRTASCCGSLI